jgi:hypothetical protein
MIGFLVFWTLWGVEGKGNFVTRIAKRTVIQGWFVHIVPNPRNAKISQAFVPVSPPLADFRAQEIRKNGFIWPNVAVKQLSVGFADKIIVF